ncbi:MAG: STAS domain-containing protein [Burkholderiaceae bacterium]|nr:STAS domain-containing protein [Burkholderiaceae bacterium]
MREILLQFSERVVLSTAMQELDRHQRFLRETRLQEREGAASIQLVADLGASKEVDTAVLGVLLHLDREARSRFGCPLVIRSASENLKSLARLSSLESVMSWQA